MEETKCNICKNYIDNICNSGRSWHYLKKPEGIITVCQGFEQKEIKQKETVNHPSHYNQGIEAIEIIESWDLNFSLGNAIKYILRAPHKSNALEDLKKAEWYIKREIERIEKLANIEQ